MQSGSDSDSNSNSDTECVWLFFLVLQFRGGKRFFSAKWVIKQLARNHRAQRAEL